MDIAGKKIMITCGGGVGDLIMFTPALRKLKKLYDCQIVFQTPRNADVIQNLPYIDEVVYMKRGTFMGKYRKLSKLRGIDALIMSDWQPNLLLGARFFGIPLVAGYPRLGHKFSGVVNKELTYWHKQPEFMAKSQAKMIAEALDIELTLQEDELHCDIAAVKGVDCKAVDAMLEKIGLAGKNYAVLAPFSSFQLRDWPLDESKKFADMFSAKYKIPMVTIGTEDKIEQALQISSYTLVGKTTLMQLTEVIRRACFMVTTDSGQMHIAGALDTPQVAMFGKDLPARWAPKNACWPIYLNYSCSPCSDETALSCDKKAACLKHITAKMVMETIEASGYF